MVKGALAPGPTMAPLPACIPVNRGFAWPSGRTDEYRVERMAQGTQAAAVQPAAFDGLYRAWFERVVRWLPAMGVASGDIEDVAQEVFVIVQRRLGSF